jgi:hypothetical protein
MASPGMNCAVDHSLLSNSGTGPKISYYPSMKNLKLASAEELQDLLDQIDYMLEKAWRANPGWFPSDHDWHKYPPVKQPVQ